jgi:hypothetical protein
MNTSWQFHVALAIGVSLVSVAGAQEKKIERSDLPAGVKRTVVEQSQGATIRGFSEEKENGETRYEAHLMVNGHRKDVLMDGNGAIVEVEEQVALESLPATVRSGLQAEAGQATITRVESITKHDKVVAYEAQVSAAGKKAEVQVGPDGKRLDHEE